MSVEEIISLLDMRAQQHEKDKKKELVKALKMVSGLVILCLLSFN